LSLLLGCQSGQRSTLSSRIKLPFEVEIVPKRPFEWSFDISGASDQDELLQGVGEALRGKGVEADCIERRDGQLRVLGRSAFAAVAPILSEGELLGPLKSKMLAIGAAFLNVELSYLPELGVDWRFLTHTNRASDIVQYALLDRARADEFLDRIRRDGRGELLSAPRMSLMNTQRGCLVMSTSHPYVQDYEVNADGTLTPKMGDASTGHMLDLSACVNNDGTTTVDLTSWTCERVSPMVCERKLYLNPGPKGIALPSQESLVKPVEFHVQFVVTPGQAVLFTNGNLVYRDRRKKRDFVKLIMLNIEATEDSKSAVTAWSRQRPEPLPVALRVPSGRACDRTGLSAGTSVGDAADALKAKGFVVEAENGAQPGWLLASNLIDAEGLRHYVRLKVADGRVEKVVEFVESP